MAAAVRSGKTIGEVANQFEVTTQTVRQAVEQFKSVAMTDSADPATA
jgi:transposase-like protein